MNWFDDLAPEDLIWQMSPPQRTFVDPFAEGYSDDPNLDYSSLLPTSQPLPQGSMDIDKDLAQWATLGSATGLNKFRDIIKGLGGKALNFAGSDRGIMAILAALASASDRQRASGGGTKMGMPAPRQYARTLTPGAYGPIARYAANGGLMQAYAQGGHVRMEDGGFVMTKRAVDGAGGPQGIQQLVPGARLIRGPGTGTSDSIPATIQGPNGVTPAKVSNGEAYVPRAAVQQAGGPKRMYALMNSLQRKA